jgi:WD40 repeat protein
VNSAAYSPDGKTIVAASGDGAKIWDATSGQELRTLSWHTDWVNSAAYSPDGKTIVTANRDGTAKIWDAQP